MIHLDQPSLAINDSRVGTVRYQMQRTLDLRENHLSPASVVARIAAEIQASPQKRLRNLVINCHGYPGFLQLGSGITRHDLPCFDVLAGKIDTIYILACMVAQIVNEQFIEAHMDFYHESPDGFTDVTQLARDYDGNIFISEMARRVQCQVVASNVIQIHDPIEFPPEFIDDYEGLAMWYGPGGNVIQWARYPLERDNSLRRRRGDYFISNNNPATIETSPGFSFVH